VQVVSIDFLFARLLNVVLAASTVGVKMGDINNLKKQQVSVIADDLTVGYRYENQVITKSNNNTMLLEIHQRAFEAIISRLRETNNVSCPLLVIDLSWKGLDDSHAIQIANNLKSAVGASVIRLRLHKNKIGDDGTIAIAKTLQGVEMETKLRYLILSGNNIGLEGARELANGLNNNRSLRHLDLSGNCLKDSGACYILNATTDNVSLVYLDLSFNEITDDCVAAIAALLRSNRTLRCLRLSDNLISNSGADIMFEALRDNTTLQELEMEGNNVLPDIVRSMRRLHRR
jgi:Leucine Rich repeat